MWKTIFVLFTFSAVAIGQDGYEIKGHIDLDDSWNRMIYLSLIEAFDELTTISGEMIIDQADIDENGNYSFSGNYLPMEDRIYRLHICKKDDPISTIIIGGREHNHIHFAMKPGDVITLRSQPGQVFREVQVTGNPVNEFLISTNAIIDRARSSSVKSSLSVRLKGEETAYKLLELIAQCPYPLGKYYAAFYLLDRFDNTTAVEQIEDNISTTSTIKSPHYEEIIDLLNYKVPQNSDDGNDAGTRMMSLLFVIPVAFIMGWWIVNRSKPRDRNADPLNDLSVQERKVLSLLAEGLSNKEISSELNIGVSTVKSHVHSIYKKLGIKSRKDVYQFRSHLVHLENISNNMVQVNGAK